MTMLNKFGVNVLNLLTALYFNHNDYKLTTDNDLAVIVDEAVRNDITQYISATSSFFITPEFQIDRLYTNLYEQTMSIAHNLYFNKDQFKFDTAEDLTAYIINL